MLFSVFFFFLPHAQHARLGVGASGRCRHGPVVLGDAGPEYPDHDHCKQREECLKEATVDLARGPGADMDTDDILEDLSNGKKQSCANKIHCSC